MGITHIAVVQLHGHVNPDATTSASFDSHGDAVAWVSDQIVNVGGGADVLSTLDHDGITHVTAEGTPVHGYVLTVG